MTFSPKLSTVKVNMAVQQEVVITFLLRHIERDSKAEMGLPDLDRQRKSPPSAEYPAWWTMTGSGDN